MGSNLKKDIFPFEFNPDKCEECKGKCCTNKKPTFLWINSSELSQIASFLGISESRFKIDYLRRDNGLYNIKDLKINGIYSCAFFNTEDGRCSIYGVRPKQCKEFPFWDQYKTNYKELIKECPGLILPELSNDIT